jgi:S-adenosylmethionine:tRNA ribosyltransferase-isomerase
VLFGAGDWRQRTEDRPPPPVLAAGAPVELAHGLRALVESVSPVSSRLLAIRFEQDGAELWSLLYRAGRPVQYSHLLGPLALWDVQTAYASRPWAAEMPSAGRPLGVGLLAALRDRGVSVASVTHAAGLSSTGDAALDAALPLPERYEVGAEAVAAVDQAHARQRRVIAVGTSVVRALEGAAENGGGVLLACEGVTDLRLGPGTPRRVVDGLLTGVHEPGTSHFELLRAFASDDVLQRAHEHASRSGYLGHEFGDYELLLAA